MLGTTLIPSQKPHVTETRIVITDATARRYAPYSLSTTIGLVWYEERPAILLSSSA